MGQQETTVESVATEEKGGGALLKHMILALLVAALMAAMLSIHALPAMAKTSGHQPPGPPQQSGNNNGHSANVFHGSEEACVDLPNHSDTGGGC
jgi:hypothetical protein